MTTPVIDALSESAGLVSVLMNTLDSDLSIDDERSRLGIGLTLNSILERLESAMAAISARQGVDKTPCRTSQRATT